MTRAPMRVSLAILYGLCILQGPVTSVQSGFYRYETYLDFVHRFHLWWDVDYQTDTVRFRLLAQTTPGEWFGIGFSDYGQPTGADVAVLWTDKDEKHHFQDAWTDDKGTLHLDDQQDYKLLVGKFNNHAVVLEFERKIDTCDDFDYIFDNGTTHIIYFIGGGHFTSPEGQNISVLRPGLQTVQLLKPDLPEAQVPQDTWTFEIVAPKVPVPDKETTYWWYTTQLPLFSTKHHIIQFESVIQKGHENLVHHIEVFHCEVGPEVDIPHYNGPGLGEGKPPGLEACRKVIGAWAMGAKALALPEEAGYPVGGEDFSRYIVLEVHYNNPDSIAGIHDSSGIRFHVTSTLRKFDAGILELGLEYTSKMAVPPREKMFPLTGDCTAECTAVGLPRTGIAIFASQLHTHLTGKRVHTKHIRNGIELSEVNRDNHYSPHFQEIRRLPQPVRILPGDALVTVCEDSTLNRRNVTLGGFAISDEMCVNYVHYYPLVNLEVCKSSIDTSSLYNFFRFMKLWDKDKTSEHKGPKENYQAIRWTPLSAHLLKNLYKTAPLSMQCNQSSGDRFPGFWEGMPQTQISVPLPPVKRSCLHWSHSKETP